MDYNELIAEAATRADIERIVSSQPSAIALVGQRGTGKYFVAKHISKNILKTQDIAKHPYFILVDARNSGIEDIREVQKKLTLKVASTENINRIVVIQHFDAFGHQAQNALLKTLEEPPEGTMIILTINSPDSVLPTVLSRVQIVDIRLVSLDTALAGFKQKAPKDIERAYLISGGAIGLMSSLINDEREHELITAIDRAKKVLQTPRYARIGMIDKIVKDKDISVLTVLDAIARVLETSYQQAINSNKSKKIITETHFRLELTIKTIDDINSGLNQKLALTRLFSAI